MSKILELRAEAEAAADQVLDAKEKRERRRGKLQKHSLMQREHRKVLFLLKMQPPMTRWKRMS